MKLSVIELQQDIGETYRDWMGNEQKCYSHLSPENDFTYLAVVTEYNDEVGWAKAEKTSKDTYVYDVYVKPECRGVGAGRLLFNALVELQPDKPISGIWKNPIMMRMAEEFNSKLLDGIPIP